MRLVDNDFAGQEQLTPTPIALSDEQNRKLLCEAQVALESIRTNDEILAQNVRDAADACNSGVCRIDALEEIIGGVGWPE